MDLASIIPLNDVGRAVAAERDALMVAISRVLDSGWFVMGKEHDTFERELADYVGVQHAIGVASGTDALQLALVAAGCQAGDRVITVANAGGYTTAACHALRLEPVYVDVDPASLLMTTAEFQTALTQRPKAVVVTHLYGAMAPVDAIAKLARIHDVVVIEDCAQAIGARLDGRRAGSFGDLATFSFYPTKNLGALGDGGAVVTSDDQRAATLRSIRQYGWGQKYHVVNTEGRNSRLDELQAAVLRTRLSGVDAGNARRRAIHAAYRDSLQGSAHHLLHGEDASYVAHLAVLRVAADRDRALDGLRRRQIAADVHYPVCDHRQPAFLDRYGHLSLPVSETAADSVLTLPCFPELRDDEIERVCLALSDL